MAKKPVSLWIKTGVFLLLAVLIASIAVFPSALKAAVAYEKGHEAQRQGRHSTAIKEYEQVLKQFPESTSVIARLAVSYFYNERFGECTELLDHIAGREVSGGLSKQINEIVRKLDLIYYEGPGLGKAMDLYGQEELEETAGRLDEYLQVNKNDILAVFYLANINFDMGRYTEAEKLYVKITELQPEFYSAYLNLAAVYRENGQLEKAAECCNKVLESNREHPQAYVALSKIEMKGNNDKAALEYAIKAYNYDSGDLNIISNLSLAYHYNNMAEDRDKMFEILRQNKYYDIAVLQSVFDGRLIIR